MNRMSWMIVVCGFVLAALASVFALTRGSPDNLVGDADTVSDLSPIPAPTPEDRQDDRGKDPGGRKRAGSMGFPASMLGGEVEAAANHLSYDSWTGGFSTLRSEAAVDLTALATTGQMTTQSVELETRVFSIGKDSISHWRVQDSYPAIGDHWSDPANATASAEYTAGSRVSVLQDATRGRLWVELNVFSNVGFARLRLLGFAVDYGHVAASSNPDARPWYNRFTRLTSPAIGNNCLEWDGHIAFQERNVVVMVRDAGTFQQDELRNIAEEIATAIGNTPLVSEPDFEALRPVVQANTHRTAFKDTDWEDMSTNDEVLVDDMLNISSMTVSVTPSIPLGEYFMDQAGTSSVRPVIWNDPVKGYRLRASEGILGPCKLVIIATDTKRLIPGWVVKEFTVESR